MTEQGKDAAEHELELIKSDGWLGNSAARIIGHHGCLVELEVQRYFKTGVLLYSVLEPVLPTFITTLLCALLNLVGY